MLTAFADEIWLAEGADIEVLGFRYPTRMAVIRLGDGALFIWSPVGLTPRLRDAVDALGDVRHIVAPNTLHHMSLTDWIAAYPEALVHAPPGLRAKRADIAIDADLGPEPAPDWVGQIDQVRIDGNRITPETLFFHRRSRTVLVCDLIQSFPSGWFTGWRALVARMDLMVAPQPSVPRKFRLAFTDRATANAAVTRVLDWPAERLVMAHGAPVAEGGGKVLANAFSWLCP